MKTTRWIIIVSLTLCFFACYKESLTIKKGPFRVLVYNEVGAQGYSHSSRSAGVSMIRKLGERYNWETEEDGDGSTFDSFDQLSQYAVVVFCNTSGNGILNKEQQGNFEKFIQSGGGFVGIHAATDTYRDRSWSWYNELVGAIIQSDPNHTNAGHQNTMDVLNRNHPSTERMESEWEKREEYYYWEKNGGYLASGTIPLLRVRETQDGNGQVNSYDAPRPISWYRAYDGGRSFYTALGHSSDNYSQDSTFIYHIAGAIRWAAAGQN